MAEEAKLASKIVAGELAIQKLLSEAELIGGIYTMGYDECSVLTNDLWKKRAGGVPQHCFLLATAMIPGMSPDPEDEEIMLLRVVGPAPLPSEAELVQVREQAMREMVVTRGVEAAAEPPVILDVLTRNEIQYSAVKAKVLGTFYDTAVNGKPLLTFGSDVDNFYSASRYKVFKPYGESLAIIASYPEMTEKEAGEHTDDGPPPARVRVGTIRYSSTKRRSGLTSGESSNVIVPVKTNVQDFVSMKTAVFGMTRFGKSNTMKILATSVFKYAVETGQKIGQLIFDPAGEYANENPQDKTALAQIGKEYVTIFKYGATAGEEGVKSLKTNFLSGKTIDVTWSMIGSELRDRGANYINSFLAADVFGPSEPSDDYSAYFRAQRRRNALFATLIKAGFDVPRDFRTSIRVKAEVLEAVNRHLGERRDTAFVTDDKGSLRLNNEDLIDFWESLNDAQEAQEDLGDWIDAGLEAILVVYTGSVGSGYRVLEPLRVYHSADLTADYAEEVLNELIEGKIVIIDLSLGTEKVLQYCSERIVNFLLEVAARRFAENLEPHLIQIFIEEAHRLFNSERMKKPEERDPYIRLAKEAAKFKIGLIYATQEVSSVDAQILSNTSNWVVTHLNNRNEVKELSKYYDFADFAELTLKAEDVGFCRLKTKSGRYIIPVQIDKFGKSMIEAARKAAPSIKPTDERKAAEK